jgi:hypothetical protein
VLERSHDLVDKFEAMDQNEDSAAPPDSRGDNVDKRDRFSPARRDDQQDSPVTLLKSGAGALDGIMLVVAKRDRLIVSVCAGRKGIERASKQLNPRFGARYRGPGPRPV